MTVVQEGVGKDKRPTGHRFFSEARSMGSLGGGPACR